MRRANTLSVLLALGSAALGLSACEGFEKSPGLLDALVAPAPPEVTVVTFDLGADRGTGDNAWTRRRTLVVAHLRALTPDIAALRGTSAAKLREVLADLSPPAQQSSQPDAAPRILAVGAGEAGGSGRDGDDLAPILYREDRFDLLAAGGLELGNPAATDGQPAANLVVWARLREKRTTRTLLVINLAAASGGPPVRPESVLALVRSTQRPGDRVVLALGLAPASAPAVLRELASELPDTFAAAAATGAVSTINAFGDPHEQVRADAILCSPGLPVLGAGVADSRPGGRFISDRHAVWTRVVLSRPEPARR